MTKIYLCICFNHNFVEDYTKGTSLYLLCLTRAGFKGWYRYQRFCLFSWCKMLIVTHFVTNSVTKRLFSLQIFVVPWHSKNSRGVTNNITNGSVYSGAPVSWDFSVFTCVFGTATCTNAQCKQDLLHQEHLFKAPACTKNFKTDSVTLYKNIPDLLIYLRHLSFLCITIFKTYVQRWLALYHEYAKRF